MMSIAAANPRRQSNEFTNHLGAKFVTQVKTGGQAPGSYRKDELLCYCDGMGVDGHGIGHEEFRIGVWSNPHLGFEEICTKLNIGQRCTACLLNIENAFYEAFRTRPEGYTGEAPALDRTRPARKRPFSTPKQSLFGLIDKVMPERPRTRLHLVPVVAAENMRTVLTLSNRYPHSIGAKSAPYRYRAEVHNESGAIVQVEELVLQAGERADVEVTTKIEAQRGDAEITTGSCWVFQYALGKGTLGSTRPHFKLVGRNGVSAVHAQVTNTPSRTQVLSRANTDERHFIHVTNPYQQPLDAVVTVAPLSDPETTKTIDVPLTPTGSALVELPNLGSRDHPSTELYLAGLSSSRRRRGHIMIADHKMTMMSADHF